MAHFDTMKSFMQRRRPGKVVQCADGRVGRTYNDEAFIDGKVRVYLFPESVRMAMNTDKASAKAQQALVTQTKIEASRVSSKEPERRLCDPATLKVIGYAD